MYVIFVYFKLCKMTNIILFVINIRYSCEKKEHTV